MSDPGDSPDERLPLLEVDSDPDRDDLSSTVSLRDSVFSFIQENGRTYTSFGSYFLPNDVPELERLDIQHHVLFTLLGRREHLAPLENPREILDIGTGNGSWAIQMAEKYPKARVYGSDISPTQDECYLPNLHWLVEDAGKPDWGSKRYDYIHTRVLMGCFEDFREIIKTSYDYLQPGGWLESQEVYPSVMCDDGTLDKETHALYNYNLKLDEACMEAGKPLRIANKLKRWYQEAGFVDVHEEVFKLPINSWPKDPQFKLIGRFWAQCITSGLQGFSLHLFTRFLGWTKEEIEVYLAPVRQSVQDRSVHGYNKFYVVWGRKPTIQEMQARQTAKESSEPSA